MIKPVVKSLTNRTAKNMYKVLCVVLMCIAAIACGGSQNPRLPQDGTLDPTPTATPTPAPTVARSGTVFIGDSIFGRWNLDSYFPGKGYVNGGWFGKRTDEILAVFPSILSGAQVCHGYDGTPSDPDFPFSCQSINPPAEIVLLVGWNDLFQGKSPTQAAANINQMVSMAHNAGVKVIMCIPYRYDSAHPASWMTPWQPCDTSYPYDGSLPSLISGIENTGVQYNAPLPNFEWLFLTHNGCQSDYTLDGIHPNASGYQQMHDFLSQII